MENKIDKTFDKVIGIGAKILLSLFAVMFGLFSIAALFFSILDKDLFSLIICGVSVFLGWVCWSVRKDIML